MHIVMLEVALARGFAYLEDLSDAGIEVSLVVRSLDAYAGAADFQGHKRATRIIEVPDTEQAEDLAGRIRDRLGPNPPDGVFCVTERCMPAAARLARDLGVPHESVETVRLLRDKAAVRALLDRAGLGTLRWRSVEQVADGLAAAEEIGYPVVVKPLSGYASIGVSVVWAPEQAEHALHEALGAPGGGRALIEEYAAGRHVSAELLVQDGRPVVLGFAERLPVRPGTTAELGGHFPAQFEQRGAARQFALDVVAALGIRNSPIHLEMLVTPTGPELIEVNGRIAGHVVTRQMELALDRSLTMDLAALATGQPVREAAEPVAVSALRHMWTEQGGVVRSVELPEEPVPGIAECRLGVGPGDLVRPLRHNYDRIGHVLTVGPTAADAARLADEARALIRVELDHVPDTTEPADFPVVMADGRHVLLLLGPDGIAGERVIDAVGAAADQVSVVWSGAPDAAAAVRLYWAERCRGRWYTAPDDVAARRALAALHAEALPVDAVVTFAPSLAALADTLSAMLRGEELPAAETATGAGPVAGPGHTVVSLLTDDGVHHLGVVEDLGADPDGHRTLRYPAPLSEADRTALLDRAAETLRQSGPRRGAVRVLLPRTGAALAQPGLDDHTRALLDAVHPRDVVSTVTAAALGRPIRLPAPRPGRHALLRTVAGPTGSFRVVEATPATEMYDDPAVASVGVPLPAGSVHHADRHAPEYRPTALWYVVTGTGETDCRDAAARIAANLRFRYAELDQRTHVLLLDRTGGAAWTTDDGAPVLPPERFRLSVLSGHPALGTLPAAPADLVQRTDILDLDAVTRTVAAVHSTHPVHRVSSGTERLLGPVAALRERLALPGDGSRYTLAVRDKAEMKRLALGAGIAHAEGRVVYQPGDVLDLMRRHGAVVVKPRDLSGSQGVTVCRDDTSLAQWLRTRFVPGRYLAEEFRSGPMCHIDAVVHDSAILAWDVSGYLRDTLAYTRGLPLSGQTCDDPRLRAAASTLLEQVVDAWRIRSAVLHLEAFDEDGGLTFCELAARPGGGGIIRAFEATRGINLRHAKLLIDAGEDPRRLFGDPVAEHAGYTVHYSRDGLLAEYDDSAVADRAYHRTVNARVGEDLRQSDFSGTGLSTHVFADDSAAEVRRLLTEAEQRIRIRVEPQRSAG
ncbi:ATP-grasp domain-containing protein [Kitasatospora sp. GP82]|uniref:ATP-grasp domain-containing protein n=1 Tax=Kitasatospora sp. GP82 TaxID=3035089 RepID=UPI0024741E25|nr:ATP-grasp domain-containing protein [Kitasatospora sp. GP82]MDH6129702.1 biotin carboxylase [Kitasatospora sp. GP82]